MPSDVEVSWTLAPGPCTRRSHTCPWRWVLRRGVGLGFLSAGSDAAADIYRRVGFVDIGTACVLELDE